MIALQIELFVNYLCLGAADDVVAPIDFEELDALEAQLGGLSDNEGEQKEKENEEDEGYLSPCVLNLVYFT